MPEIAERTSMKLNSIAVAKPWGRETLPAPFSAEDHDGQRIGEIWFEAGAKRLDLMVKYIFTSEKLSIQVHPSDEQAQGMGLPQGKEECWYILDAETDATVGIGTTRALSADELREASLSGSIEALMDWKPVKAGDFFYIPAGTVHAIGAGVSLIEIQQNADITYRLYDYGRPRELHLDNGIAVSKAEHYPHRLIQHFGTDKPRSIVAGPKFQMALCGQDIPELPGAGPYYFVPLRGAITANGETAVAGECMIADGLTEIDTSAEVSMFVARACKRI